MKKIKTLLAIPALVAVLPATLCLSQCAKGNNDPIIDPTQSDKVDMTTTKGTDGSTICTLTLKSAYEQRQKIGTITVKIGEQTLVEGTDYSRSNGSTVITIFKTTLDKYQGKIVITPTVVDKELTGIIVKFNKTSFTVNETLTKDNITVQQSLEGTPGSQINWDDQKLKIFEKTAGDITTTFKQSGFKFTTSGEYQFTVSYNSKFEQQQKVNVAKQTYLVSFAYSDKYQCVNLPEDIAVVEGKKWSEFEHTPTAKSDFVNLASFDYHWEDKDGNTIDDNYTVTSNFTAYWVLDALTSGKTGDYPCDTEVTSGLGAHAYIPTACSPLKTIELAADTEYTFSIDTSGKSVKYFWITNADGLIPLYKNNFISVKVGDTEITDYQIYSYSNGSYISFGTPADTTITIKFRILVNNKKFIPVFEVA